MFERLFYLFLKLLSHIPLSLSRYIGKMLGVIYYFLPAKRKTVAFENIRCSFGASMGKEELKRLHLRVIIHFAQMLFEVPHILRMTPDNIGRYVIFAGEENLKRAIKKGKGVFILTGHLGNWELMSVAASIHFGNLSIVARPFDCKPLENVMSKMRSRFGAEIIPKQKAMRKLLDAINRKRIIGVLLDQNVDWYEGACVQFFGRWACANKGLALLALKSGTPVLPAFPIRQGDGRYLVTLGEEVPLIRTGDRTKDIEENTAQFTKIIEDTIRCHPDHWFWFHNRWKTRPCCKLPEDYYNFQKSLMSG